MTEKPNKGKIDDLAQKYLDNKISFHEALAQATSYKSDNSAFQRLLDILNTTKNAPKTTGCKLDNSL